MQHFFQVIILCSLGLLQSQSVFAHNHKTIKVGIDHWPPFSMLLHSKQEESMASGIDLEVMALVAKGLQSKLVIIPCPFKRCLSMMKTGQIDMLTSLQLTQARQAYMHFVTPHYYSSNKVFYTLKASNIKIDRYSDLLPLSIGLTLGHHNNVQFDEDTLLNKTLVPNDNQLFTMLSHDRLDTILSVEITANYYINQFGLGSDIQKMSFGFQGTQGYLAISKRSWLAQYQEQVNRLLNELIQQGEVQGLINNFLITTEHKQYKVN